MGRWGKETLRRDSARLYHFQVYALIRRPANRPEKRSDRFDGLTTFANEFTHVAIGYLHGNENAELILASINHELILVLDKHTKNGLDEFVSWEWCGGI
jgi:hypothetical protein